MAKRKTVDLTAGPDSDELLVNAADTGIDYLIMITDGFSFRRFGKERQTYVLVKDVIAWHEKEAAQTGHATYKQMANIFQDLLDRWQPELNQIGPRVKKLPAGQCAKCACVEADHIGEQKRCPGLGNSMSFFSTESE